LRDDSFSKSCHLFFVYLQKKRYDKKITCSLFIVTIIITAIVLVNTFRFTKDIPHKQALEQPTINDSAIRHMTEAGR